MSERVSNESADDGSGAEAPRSDILIVDDEREHAQVMCEALMRLGHRCDVTYSLPEARGRMAKKAYDVVVTDLVMEGRRDGLSVLDTAMERVPPPPVLLVTAHADIPTCKEALSRGAFDYIEKPLDLEYFRAQVNRAAMHAGLVRQNQELRDQLADAGVGAGFEAIVGNSPGMRNVVQKARQVAATSIPVLILGESGTGKELVARAIHESSPRRKNRLVTLNCAGLSESILEDELFGHVKGAFTDARSERTGRFEHANKGTIFLDEIGDMPGPMQAKLLRVLENGEVVRLGSNDPVKVDVRVISATNQNLDEMVAEKQFREDLYFRIKGVAINIPPLRERREDIPLLIHFFIQQAAERNNKEVDGLTPEAQRFLMSRSWKGNVRELKSTIEYMVAVSPKSTLNLPSLPDEMRPTDQPAGDAPGIQPGITIDQAERELIRSTLRLTHGNREQAAKMLGIGERTLYRKIKDYELTE